MTGVGHSLTGLAFGALAFGVFAPLAGGPDVPAPFSGHGEYLVSHNVFVNLGVITGVAALAAAASRLRATLRGRPMVCAGAAAWLSPLLLDSFRSHGKSVGILCALSLGTSNKPQPGEGSPVCRQIETLSFGRGLCVTKMRNRLRDPLEDLKRGH